MILYLTVRRRELHTSNFFCNETILVQKVVYFNQILLFFLNNALPHQLVTMQGKVLKI